MVAEAPASVGRQTAAATLVKVRASSGGGDEDGPPKAKDPLATVVKEHECEDAPDRNVPGNFEPP